MKEFNYCKFTVFSKYRVRSTCFAEECCEQKLMKITSSATTQTFWWFTKMLTAHTRVHARHVCHRAAQSFITHKPTKQLNK